MSLRLWTPLLSFALAGALVAACGGASDNDFEAGDGSAGEPVGGGGGQGGSGQGGSSSGSGGSTEGGSTATGGSSTGGSPTGGSPSGGASGTGAGGVTGGASGTGNGGATGGSDPMGGAGGSRAGGGGAGAVAGRAGGGGQGGSDCDLAIQNARTALAAAQLCNPLAGGMVCTGTVEDLCGCTVPVNDPNSEATKNYLDLREPAVKCGVACLAIPCMEPTSPMCGLTAAGADRIVAAASCRWAPR